MITTYIGVGTNIDREQHAKVAYLELQKLGERSPRLTDIRM